MPTPPSPSRLFGWDIGGSNTKLALVRAGSVIAVRSHAFELRRARGDLGHALQRMVDEILPTTSDTGEGLSPAALRVAGGRRLVRATPDVHAVTMTAELSRAFLTKGEGVSFVLDAVGTAFPADDIRVFAVDGRFLSPAAARRDPLAVAASNWAATARVVAARYPDAILIDIGTTSTDIIPIVDGVVAALGRTDPERLVSGELVYTGALRTPAEAMASQVPFRGELAAVAAEGFALAGDVHRWRGDLAAHDYTCETPDGRGATRDAAGHRLARVVCADREMLDDDAVSAIAGALAAAQEDRVREALERVCSRHPRVRVAIVAGLGAFIAARAARAAGLDVRPLAADVGEPAAYSAPAACVALLCEHALGRTPRGEAPAISTASAEPAPEDDPARSVTLGLVVKLGGGLLQHPDDFSRVLDAIAGAARSARLVVVPGGGVFADAVRGVDDGLGLAADAAHWMAVLAMDQYAHLVASRLESGVVVREAEEVAAALAAGRVPVLAPFQWLRRVDPLPHSWDVTSDSIAAWVAHTLGAPSLVLVKPPGACGPDLVDAHFSTALADTVTARAIAADDVASLRAALAAGEDRPGPPHERGGAGSALLGRDRCCATDARERFGGEMGP
jgi:probable H4MPT-linked C1 transfer pathway protein